MSITEPLATTTPVSEELRCPLCDYDLRGLAEHRCPECGHAFDPEQLRRHREEALSWLYEHARGWRRSSKAFCKTAIYSMWPFTFWRAVRAEHRVIPHRLLSWLVGWGSVVTGIVGLAICGIIYNIWSMNVERVSSFRGPAAVTLAVRRELLADAVSIVTNQWMPVLGYRYMLFLHALAWPIVVLLVLQIFGTTLRRANIRVGHLVRCAAYTVPTLVIVSTILVGLQVFTRSIPSEYRNIGFEPRDATLLQLLFGKPIMLLSTLVAAIVSTVHLGVAHAWYLRLPQPLTTALMAQAVTWLTIITGICLTNIANR